LVGLLQVSLLDPSQFCAEANRGIMLTAPAPAATISAHFPRLAPRR